MIIYATKKTVDRYGIKMPEEFQNKIMRPIVLDVYNKEKGNKMVEWGAKLFYFDRRKCIQFCHFASKLTIVLVDIKKGDLETIGQMIAMYLLDIYSDDKEMTDLLKRWFKDYTIMCFAKITDRSIIAKMNNFQNTYLMDGYTLYHYIEGNTLKTIKLNRDINKYHYVSYTIDGKTKHMNPKERFAELLKDYYK